MLTEFQLWRKKYFFVSGMQSSNIKLFSPQPTTPAPSAATPTIKCEYVPVQNCTRVPKRTCDQKVTERPEEVCVKVPVQTTSQVWGF